MDIRNDILSILLEYPQYKLVGAYAITKSLDGSIEWDARITTDLDIRICCDKDESEINFLRELLESNNYLVETNMTRKGNYRLLVKKNDSYPLKIDIEFKPGDDINTNIKSIDESIRDKFELFMHHPDREFKHLVDVIICLNANYHNGITKEQFLDIVDESCLRKLDLNTLLHLATKFKPNELNGLTMEEYAIAFDTLVKGLIDSDIDYSYIFKNNRWYQGD